MSERRLLIGLEPKVLGVAAVGGRSSKKEVVVCGLEVELGLVRVEAVPMVKAFWVLGIFWVFWREWGPGRWRLVGEPRWLSCQVLVLVVWSKPYCWERLTGLCWL